MTVKTKKILEEAFMLPDQKKKVAICGSASRTKDLAPYTDPEFETWGLAWRTDALEKCDRVFDMHPIDSTRTHIPKGYTKKLADHPKTVILCKEDSRISNAVVFPKREVDAYLKSLCKGTGEEYSANNYYMSSIAYMFTLAMFLGYEEIHIYGVDLIDDDEYTHQRPNQEYLIGLARGAGIKVCIPRLSALCSGTHLYGYTPPLGDGVITLESLQKRHAEVKLKHTQALTIAQTADGALQILEEQINLFKKTRNGINLKQLETNSKTVVK